MRQNEAASGNLADHRSNELEAPGILTGLIGEGIGGSRSPMLHQAEADAQGLRLIYRRLDLEQLGATVVDLPRLLDAAALMGFSGLNITHPCKQAVIPLLDELSEGASRVGAVNTVLFCEGRRVGHNTDEAGFAESFARHLPAARLDAVAQVGAGGAGAATAAALVRLGCGELRIVDTDPLRAAILVDRLSGSGTRVMVAASVEQALHGASGVVNATPMGMAGHPGTPFDPSLLRPDQWVADIVYFPLVTALLAAAAERGCATLDGSGMVVFQAARAFDLFTGKVADRERMLASFAASLIL